MSSVAPWAAAIAKAPLAARRGRARSGRWIGALVGAQVLVSPAWGQVEGDAARGRAIVTSRQTGLCLLCHSGPFPEESFQGTLAPSLAGVGSRLSADELRLRIADGRRLNPATLMPSYGQVDGLRRVGAAWRGKPLLSAQQIEDVVALLKELKQ